MNIVLLGPPGAGKGTQAVVLAKKLSLPHISTGDLLRENVSAGTELGEKAKDYMNKGLLVPDELVKAMLVKRFENPDVKPGFILDGYPRNSAQAKTLDEVLSSKGISIGYVFYLDSSEPVIIQRLSGRLVCKNCGANFHITNMPPKNDKICDNCGGGLYQRPDDREETIKKRLDVYRQEVSPLIEYYKTSGKLHRVLADGDAGIVLNEIMRITRGQ